MINFARPDPSPRLVVKIQAPPGTTDEALERVVAELVADLDGLHRSLGGSGLKVDRLVVDGREFPIRLAR